MTDHDTETESDASEESSVTIKQYSGTNSGFSGDSNE